ncbi:unnamed protein product, partial [Owenia fusiformis]
INQAGWTVNRLFKKEWRTDGYLTLPEKHMREQTSGFRAFYGDYEMDVIVDGNVVETREFSVKKGSITEINVEINEPEKTDIIKRSAGVFRDTVQQFEAVYGLN